MKIRNNNYDEPTQMAIITSCLAPVKENINSHILVTYLEP